MKTLRDALVLLLIAAVPTALAVLGHPELADRERAGLAADAVRPTEAMAWGEAVLWIDSRDAAARARGTIPGAIPFDEGDFSASLGAVLAAWSPGRRLVVFCDSAACGASRDLAARLREAGLDDVHHLHGGWEAWQAARDRR